MGSGFEPLSGANHLLISTERLDIRPCDATAARELAGIGEDPLVRENFQLASDRYGTRCPTTTWLHDDAAWAASQRLSLAVRHREGETIGLVQLAGQQLGYFLAPAYWNHGYGFEMVEAVCRHHPKLLGISNLVAIVVRENIASRRILEHVGFAFKGLAPTGGPWQHTRLRYELNLGRELSS